MLKDYHLSGESAQSCNLTAATPNSWEAQTFTPFTSYTATSIALKCRRNDSSASGTVTIGIYNTTAGLPSGLALATGTINIADLLFASPGSWQSIVLSVGVAFVAGTRYAIVINGSISAGDLVYFRTSGATNYAFGTRAFSTDAGSSWSLFAGTPNLNDVVFKISDDSSYDSQVMFVGGNVSGGNHLWKILDDGETLTVDNSYALDENVTCMAFSSVSRRLYIGIVNSIYCYDVDTMTLIDDWGSSGSINLGVTINDIAIDSVDYLAVGHNTLGSYKIFSLYDDTGTLVWTAGTSSFGTIGWKVAFSLSGNINGSTLDGAVGKYLSVRLQRSDGALLNWYDTRVNLNEDGVFIASNNDSDTKCFVTRDSIISLYDQTASEWIASATNPSIFDDAVHASDFDLLIVSRYTTKQLYGFYDVDGGGHPWADYAPISTIPLSNKICSLIKNSDNELYIVDIGGFVGTCNLAGSCRSSVQASTTSLNAVVWTGNQNIAPVITTQSIDTTVEEGDLVNFFVTATGTPDPTYQWYKDDVELPGETDSTLSFTSVRTDAGTYKCIVTNVEGEDTSDPIVLTVNYIEITAQSSNTTLDVGNLLTLFVTADGFPSPTYQWYKDDVELVGEITNIFTKYITLSDIGTYKCKVSNVVGDIYSTDILVTIAVNPYRWNPLELQLDIDRTII